MILFSWTWDRKNEYTSVYIHDELVYITTSCAKATEIRETEDRFHQQF